MTGRRLTFAARSRVGRPWNLPSDHVPDCADWKIWGWDFPAVRTDFVGMTATVRNRRHAFAPATLQTESLAGTGR